MDIGSAIKEIRVQKGITQKSLAQMCGLSANAMCLLEKNVSFPSRDTITRICSALSIPVSYLLFYSITDDDVPEDKRIAFRALKEPMKTVLVPEQ